MKKHLDFEILLIPLLFVLPLAILASTRIALLGGPLLALPMMLVMSVPVGVRSLDRGHDRLRYFLTNIAATGCICLLIWSIRSAVLALLR